MIQPRQEITNGADASEVPHDPTDTNMTVITGPTGLQIGVPSGRQTFTPRRPPLTLGQRTHGATTALVPGGGGPGAIVCGALGLPANCSWADAAAAGAGALVGGGSGGSEPPSGDTGPPGSFAPNVPSGGGTGCTPPAVMVAGRCVDVTAALPGGDPFVSAPAGDAVLGVYGVAMTPMAETITRRKCLPGMVLGKDGLCYDRLAKRDRMWNPGTKPLLTGGEMSAINKAARAAKRLHTTKKKLRKVESVLKRL